MNMKKLLPALAILLSLAVAFSLTLWVVGLITPEPLCEETLLRRYFVEHLGMHNDEADAVISIVLPHNIAGLHQFYDAIYDTLEDEELTAYLLQWIAEADIFEFIGEESRADIAQLFFDFVTDLLLFGNADAEIFATLPTLLAVSDLQQMLDKSDEVDEVGEFFIRVLTAYRASVTEPMRADFFVLIEWMVAQTCLLCGYGGDCECAWACWNCGHGEPCWQCWGCLSCTPCACDNALVEQVITLVYHVYLTYLGDLNSELGSGVLLGAMVRTMGEYALHINSFMQLRENVESTALFEQLHAALPEIQAYASPFARHMSDDLSDFPADYAGAFIDENNVLHILLTSTDNLALYQQAIDGNATVNFVPARFSLNELMTIQRALSYDMIMLGVEWSQPCQRNNVVEIQLIDPGYQIPVLMHLAMHIPGFNEHSIIFI